MSGAQAVPRRVFLAGAVAALLRPTAISAQPARRYRIGFLGNSSAALEQHLVQAFRDGLRERGYVDGESAVIEYRWAEGDFARLPALAAELVALPVDVLVVAATPATLAAMRATKSVPIVMAVSADAVGNRLVKSLARPGGNVTGASTRTHELDGKRLEILKEAMPRLSRVAFLWNAGNPANVLASKEARRAAKGLHVVLEPEASVRGGADLDAALDTLARGRPEALFVMADRLLLAHRDRIVGFAARQRLPATFPYRDYVVAGGLMSYAPNFTELFRHAAVTVDKILRGANPGDLPIEQPTKFELTINVKTARTLGLAVPPALLARADQVID